LRGELGHQHLRTLKRIKKGRWKRAGREGKNQTLHFTPRGKNGTSERGGPVIGNKGKKGEIRERVNVEKRGFVVEGPPQALKEE